MAACSPPSRILVTGASGYLGRHLVSGLEAEFEVRAFDIVNGGGFRDFVQGSVTDRDALGAALDGVAGVVSAHMLPNRPGNYDSPELPFDVNVKGTAILFAEAAKRSITRHVLISSVSVLEGDRKKGNFLSRDLPPSPEKLYDLTKTLQEATARYHHEKDGVEVTILRPAYITNGDTLEDKYGIRRPSVNWQAIDPRDIAQATSAALKLASLRFEIFHLMSGPDAETHADVSHARNILGWEPRFRFEGFPRG